VKVGGWVAGVLRTALELLNCITDHPFTFSR